MDNWRTRGTSGGEGAGAGRALERDARGRLGTGHRPGGRTGTLGGEPQRRPGTAGTATGGPETGPTGGPATGGPATGPTDRPEPPDRRPEPPDRPEAGADRTRRRTVPNSPDPAGDTPETAPARATPTRATPYAGPPRHRHRRTRPRTPKPAPHAQASSRAPHAQARAAAPYARPAPGDRPPHAGVGTPYTPNPPASSAPTNTAPSPASREASTLAAARKARPVSARRRVSYENVEYVVSAPHRPVASRACAGEDRSAGQHAEQQAARDVRREGAPREDVRDARALGRLHRTVRQIAQGRAHRTSDRHQQPGHTALPVPMSRTPDRVSERTSDRASEPAPEPAPRSSQARVATAAAHTAASAATAVAAVYAIATATS
ncbi:hypothetical protein SCALM49S_00820 [Streptomyces californicus]